jgi:hypothetical protein
VHTLDLALAVARTIPLAALERPCRLILKLLLPA